MYIPTSLPGFTYTGQYSTELRADWGWVIRFKTSGTLTITDRNRKVDAFLVGGGGGTYGTAELNDGSYYYHCYSPAQLQDYLTENCDYVFILDIDTIFTESYSELFLGESRTGTPRRGMGPNHFSAYRRACSNGILPVTARTALAGE